MVSGAEQLLDWMGRRFPQSPRPQVDTAALFGWDLTFINKLVQGKRAPGLANAVKIQRVTGISVEAWLSDPVDTSSVVVSAGVANDQ